MNNSNNIIKNKISGIFNKLDDDSISIDKVFGIINNSKSDIQDINSQLDNCIKNLFININKININKIKKQPKANSLNNPICNTTTRSFKDIMDDLNKLLTNDSQIKCINNRIIFIHPFDE